MKYMTQPRPPGEESKHPYSVVEPSLSRALNEKKKTPIPKTGGHLPHSAIERCLFLMAGSAGWIVE